MSRRIFISYFTFLLHLYVGSSCILVTSIRGRTQERSVAKSESILELVAASPVAASQKDRKRWLGLFDADASIEDPAGLAPFAAAIPGRSLGMFYDIFIAKNDISFIGEEDYVCGHMVVRDGVIVVEVNKDRSFDIPVFLRYEVSNSSKIKSLRAHWKPARAMLRALACRPGGLGYLTSVGKQLYRSAGVGGIGGFVQAVVPIAIGARITLARLKEYLEGGRYYEAVSLFSFLDGGQIVLHSDTIEVYPAGYLTMGELKLLSLGKFISSGRFLSFRCELLLSGRRFTAVAFVTFEALGLKIRKLEFFIRGR